MRNGLTPKQQGDRGEASAIEWLVGQGAEVFVPLTSSPDVDVVALGDERVLRVQVKTTGCVLKDRWQVTLCTRGGNQSWTGLVKRFSSERCDFLFVLAADGRRWWIPSASVEGSTGILLGGPKYAGFEVEPGRGFASLEGAPSLLSAASAG